MMDHLTFPEKINAVTHQITPADLAATLGIEIVGGKIRSPFNEGDHTPSCHLYEDHWYDFSTGQKGDVIDLYQALRGTGRGRAVNDLLRMAIGQRPAADQPAPRRVALPMPDLSSQWFALPQLNEQQLERWTERLPPISSETLSTLVTFDRIRGADDKLCIVHFDDLGVRGIKVRTSEGTKSAIQGSVFTSSLYRLTATPDADTLVLTEGETDSWALMPHLTCDIAALPAGAGTWKDQWLADLKQYTTIYTAFDNDRAGEQATEKVRRSIGWGRWRELKVPTLYNDVREAMAAGWEPKM